MSFIREPNCFSCVCVYCDKEDICTNKPCYNKENEVNVYECIPVFPNDCNQYNENSEGE